jgi:hypothetical protein
MAGTLSVQSILARFLPGQTLDSHRRKVCARLTDCRTARTGGMEMCCDHRQARSVCYYGCRDRHCPQCQGHATEQWSARQRAGALLPFGVYATSHLERLGSAPSRCDLSLFVRRSLGHA